mgnify:CR=1 FL=1
MPCSTLSRPAGFLLAFIALMAFVKAATAAGEQENPYIVIKPSKDSGSLVVVLSIFCNHWGFKSI